MNSSKVSRTFFLIFSSSAAFDIAAGLFRGATARSDLRGSPV